MAKCRRELATVNVFQERRKEGERWRREKGGERWRREKGGGREMEEGGGREMEGGERWRRKEEERDGGGKRERDGGGKREEGGGREYYSTAFGIAMAVMVRVSSVLGKMKTWSGGFQVHPYCRLHTAESYVNPDDVQH